MSVIQNLNNILQIIEQRCQQSHRKREEIFVIVVTKNRTIDEMKEAYAAGCRDFGESRVNEALSKMDAFASDIRWHFIGKLQSNKINKVLGKFSLIHSVDSFSLAEKISEASLKKGIKSSILLEVNTSGEKSKSGLSREEWKDIFPQLLTFSGIHIQGLMTMAPLTSDESLIRQTFSRLRYFRDEIEDDFACKLELLSMGMSHDFEIAIDEGANLLRIGTKIFSPTEGTIA